MRDLFLQERLKPKTQPGKVYFYVKFFYDFISLLIPIQHL
jgi:hypothetical protein